MKTRPLSRLTRRDLGVAATGVAAAVGACAAIWWLREPAIDELRPRFAARLSAGPWRAPELRRFNGLYTARATYAPAADGPHVLVQVQHAPDDRCFTAVAFDPDGRGLAEYRFTAAGVLVNAKPLTGSGAEVVAALEGPASAVVDALRRALR
jgi:hypothetical protein